ncbi:MAG: ABC transporter ATP-binding protein [Phycisphaerales bacterium]|nr:ABC transporter ATP-binding protein [Phycisphaerales bacterium]
MPLSASNLSFAYPKGPTVLKQIECSIHPGSITAIIGPNGAGKSTLLRILAGLTTPDEGSVTLDGSSIHSLSAQSRARQIAFIAQRSSLAFDFDARMVISFGRLALEKDAAAVDRAIERFGLIDLADRPVGSLSIGQQQRVSLARAWAQLDPFSFTDSAASRYLLADEPTSAMDPKHQLDTMDALRDLAEQGIGVAFVAHDLTLASRAADRVVLMSEQGTIEAHGPIDEVLTPDRLTKIFETPFISGDIQGRRFVIPDALSPDP